MSVDEQLKRMLSEQAELHEMRSRLRVEFAVDKLTMSLHRVIEARHFATFPGGETSNTSVKDATEQFTKLREDTVNQIYRNLKQPERCSGCGLDSWDEPTVAARSDGKVRCADCESKQ